MDGDLAQGCRLIFGEINGVLDMMTFEIVATGMGYTYLSSKMFKDNPVVVDHIIDLFSRIKFRNNTEFSVLFNAFTEEKIGAALQIYKKAFYSIHSDSGGLQIVTLGKKMTPELYDKVYATQAKYSDIAMSFDEIPVITRGQSSMGSTRTRFFDASKIDEMARKSGKNITRQIQFFLDEKSKAKPFLIAHGNCRESFIQWVETMYDEIPSHLHKHIGGISISGVALGKGTLEDIQKAYYAKDFLQYTKNIHLLGVGTTSRILPFLVLENSGYYGQDVHLSYDSTTQTAGIIRCKSHVNGVEDVFGRIMSVKFERKYKEVDALVGLANRGIDVDTFFRTMRDKNMAYLKNKDGTFNEERVKNYATIILGWFMSSVDDLTGCINRFSRSMDEALHFAEKFGISREISTIFKIKDIETFEEWSKSHRHVIKSEKIEHHNAGTLEGLL